MTASFWTRRPAMRPAVRLLAAVLCCLVAAAILLPAGLVSASSKGGSSQKKAEKKEEKKEEKKSEGKEGEAKKKEEPPEPKPPLDKLQEAARNNLQLGDVDSASRALYLIHYHYPDDPSAEPSLWLSANLLKEIAQGDKEPKWDKVLDRFRLYLSFYPKSAHAAEAYFEVGRTYQILHLHREAQAYFKLFLERYPDSPLAPQAMRGYRNALLREGRSEEAAKAFATWRQSKDPMVRAMAEAGEGMLKSAAGDYQGALPIFQKVLTSLTDYPVLDPEILRHAGLANLRAGKIEEGREQLFHYLTLAGNVAERPDVLLELAESYYRAGAMGEAQRLYTMISAEGGSERAVLISALRQAQRLDDKDTTLSKWQRHSDLKDPTGDRPYLAVLEKLFRDPVLAQDARWGLFLRYQARGDLGKALDVGGNFLRNVEPGPADTPQGTKVGRILGHLVEELLKAKRYQAICDLYADQYRHIKDYPNGRLLMMVGEAMEAMDLQEQAASLYYLAAQQPIPEADKTALYFRRAAGYLRLGDLEALDRLLAYVRKQYQGKPEMGEIDYYSARLSAARGEVGQAVHHFEQSVTHPTYPDSLPRIGGEALTFALEHGRLEEAENLIAKGTAAGWLKAEEQQEWWLRVGNGWRFKSDWQRAAAGYRQGLVKGLPEDGEAAQAIHLYLGDVLLALGEQEEGLAQYQKAAQGDTPLLKQMASQRLVQHQLDRDLATMAKEAARK